MSIAARLGEDLKVAMKAKDKDRVACIRQVRAKVQEAVNAPDFAGEVDDALYLQIIASYVKALRKGIAELEPAGERGKALRTQYATEIDYLDRYMPKLLDADATRKLVASTIAELGVKDAKQAGRVMGVIMKEHRSEVDAALVRELVDAALR